jgi:hypothetical protein
MRILKSPTKIIAASALLTTLAIAARPAHAQLSFVFTDGATLAGLSSSNPTLYNNVRNGFQSAANLWTGKFSDSVTINLTIDFPSLASGILGSTGADSNVFSYSAVRTALTTDQLTADDALAVSNLQNTTALQFVTSTTTGARVFDSDTTGTNSNNNRFLDVNRANAKALGLIAGNDAARDAQIDFSSNFSWDFDRSNGITGGTFDFVGVAAHEIGHVMGFVSGVDSVDAFSGPNLAPGQTATNLNSFAVFSVLDLYRYSNAADTTVAGTKFLDLAQGGTAGVTPYFSLNGGTTNLALFATGSFDGDGRQASHWKDNLGIGIMDPTFAPGELGVISLLDERGLDAIGWNRTSAINVPEPGTLALMLFASASLLPFTSASVLPLLKRRRAS